VTVTAFLQILNILLTKYFLNSQTSVTIKDMARYTLEGAHWVSEFLSPSVHLLQAQTYKQQTLHCKQACIICYCVLFSVGHLIQEKKRLKWKPHVK